MWKHMTDAAKRKAKQKWTIEKSKFDNVRELRGIFFIQPDDEEFISTIKNGRRKLEVPMSAAMPCKTPVNCRGETCTSIGQRKTKYACIVDADDCKRGEFTKSLQIGTQVYSDASSIQNTGCLGRSGKNEKNWRQFLHDSWWKSETRKKWSRKQGIREEKFILRHWWIFVILRIRSWNRNFKNTKVESYSEVTLWMIIQDHTQYLLNKDHQHHKWQSQKSWTLSQDHLDAQDKQQMQYPLKLRSKWKMLRRYWKRQSQNVQIFGYVYQSTNGQNHCPVWKTQSLLLSAICTVILWQGYYEKGNSRKFFCNTVG